MIKLNNFNAIRSVRSLLAGAVSIMLLAGFPFVSGAHSTEQDRPDQRPAPEISIPHTAQEHRERAEQYRKKAAEYRQEAENHRKMLVEYTKTVATLPKERGENAYIKRMRLHCEKYINDAESLARDADEMAKWHLMRARELEGK
jgi:hypothetical protein